MNTQRTGIVVFAFGIPKSIRSNKIIIDIASELAKSKGVPVFSQRGMPFGFGIDVEYAMGDMETPTLKIADQAVKWAWRRSLSEIIIVAAGPHAKRCKKDIETRLKEERLPIKVSICPETDLYDGFWFCKGSKQFRTRSPLCWRVREWALMNIPFWLYRQII